jgi:hypothetical protein
VIVGEVLESLHELLTIGNLHIMLSQPISKKHFVLLSRMEIGSTTGSDSGKGKSSLHHFG